MVKREYGSVKSCVRESNTVGVADLYPSALAGQPQKQAFGSIGQTAVPVQQSKLSCDYLLPSIWQKLTVH